jgi:hypothetical protein
VIPTSNQDGRQAKNRKKGGMKLKKKIPLGFVHTLVVEQVF